MHFKKELIFSKRTFFENVSTKAKFLLQQYYSDLSQTFGPFLEKL